MRPSSVFNTIVAHRFLVDANESNEDTIHEMRLCLLSFIKMAVKFNPYSLLTTMDQCALDAKGNLKDASEIQWYNDKDDNDPISRQLTGEGTGCRPKRNAVPAGKLRDPNNTEKPGIASQKKAVKQYRVTQAKVSTSSSIPSQPVSLPATQATHAGVLTAANSQISLEQPSSYESRATVATKRQISSVSVHSGDDDDETTGEGNERPMKKKGDYSNCYQM